MVHKLLIEKAFVCHIDLTIMALILSINEEKDLLTLAERLLTGEGHQVISFEKVQEAMEWLKGHFPDLVLASGGRHGEKARETVNLLKKAGFPGSRILLLTSPGSLTRIRKVLQTEVREVMSEISDHEDLLRLINASIVESQKIKSGGG